MLTSLFATLCILAFIMLFRHGHRGEEEADLAFVGIFFLLKLVADGAPLGPLDAFGLTGLTPHLAYIILRDIALYFATPILVLLFAIPKLTTFRSSKKRATPLT